MLANRSHCCFLLHITGINDIKALKVKCDNKFNGCQWAGELGSLETHLQSCDFVLVPCTNQCKTGNDMVTKLSRKHLKHHLYNNCSKRQYECPHCKEKGEYQERTTTHLETCPKIKVQCPISQCRVRVCQSELLIHQFTCKYELVPCKYAAFGCEEKLLRKDLAKHEENDQLHFRVTKETVLELMQKFALFQSNTQMVQDAHKEELLKVKSASLTPCTLKLANYNKYKIDNTTFYSPPFYTSYSGYKMCLMVYANGNTDAEGTHVSVYACILQGDHDEILTWPFTGRFTVELLNQLENNNYYKKTFAFTADHAASKRMVERERGAGLGWPIFISHASLTLSANVNTQYLKDDSLVLRISTELPDHKPWLECTM